MSSSWTIGLDHADDGNVLCIDVEDPGYGRLWIYTNASAECTQLDHTELTGGLVGALLEEVTAIALGQPRPDVLRPILPGWVRQELAARMLPAVIRATVLAGAGTDRYERLMPWPEDPPAEPLCVHCNEGSPYHQAVTISEWCTDHGHTPFGHRDMKWDQAQRLHDSDRRWWESMQQIRGGVR